MSLDSIKFIGWSDGDRDPLPFDHILEQHSVLRDTIATTLAGDPDSHQNLWAFVALRSFSYAFNAYKAIGLLLPNHYHESAAVILRQMWEVSLNLHWIERDPGARSQDFSNFTAVEMRKSIEQWGDRKALKEFDEATDRFQSKFRFRKHGKPRAHNNFSRMSVSARSKELGEPWRSDYELVFHMSSMHAHGAPGAILHDHFVEYSESPETREKNSTALIAYLSMKTIVEDVHLLVRQGFAEGSQAIDEAFKKTRL